MDEYHRLMHDLFGDTVSQDTESEVRDDAEDTHESDDDTQDFMDDEVETQNESGDEVEDSHASNETQNEGGNGDQTQDNMTELGPQTGMEFDSRESLFQAYQHFAKVQGFCVASRNIKGDKYYMICCDKGRKVDVKKYTKRINCPARINAIKQDNGCWKVSTVRSTHNHDLDPSMSVFMAGHRSLDVAQQRTLEAVDITGVPPCKNARMMEVMAGGPENLGATVKDCLNFINKRRRLRLGEGDSEAIHQLFLRLQTKDRNFFHLMDIDDDGRLRNVMWIHPRSIAAYQDFHDVISFDTTYLVNRYKMPLATVVGVNHHYQSILLGCALLTHEHAESFKWFFSNWLVAMGGVHPTAMLTDQCESIKSAVREVMPDTIHRYCWWHISAKMKKKFKGVADYKKCSSDFYSVVNESVSIDEFERRWDEFVNQHSLQNNRWMKDLHEEREKWVPIYLNHFFWAGMVSTQRSESMHAFFDGYVNSRSTLKTFVEQYEIAMTTKIRKEMHADYQSKFVTITCQSDFKWEEQFARAYTNNVFKLLQKEIKKIWNCNVWVVVPSGENDDGVERYEVMESRLVWNRFYKDYSFIVEYRSIGEYISCDCRKLQSKGILCVHILKVLSYKRIELVNERYILRRWRKDVYRPHASIYFAGGYPHMTDEYKQFQEIERIFHKCVDMSQGCLDKLDFVKGKCLEAMNGLTNWNPAATSRGTSSAQHGDGSGTNPTIRDPLITPGRGRPRQMRFQSSAERGRSRGRGQGRGTGRNAGRTG